MTDKAPMEFSQYVGPDSLRKTTQLLKNLYDLHTKRYCGYEDINGSQYVGTVENFGSEMLLEARKMLMDKPSLKNIFIENSFDFYFDIQYSEMINTYDQQNMLCAILRKDVFLSNKTYRIRFDDVDFVNIPRSQSWSDPIVYKDPYIRTKTPPTLIITDENGTVEEKTLILSDKEDVDTTYYFHLYDDMVDMYITSYEEIINDKTLYTTPIDDSMNGRPFMWMCVNSLSYLPDIGFANNAFKGSQFLTIGTNGHDSSLVYPAINTRDSDFNDGYWILKIIPDDNDDFIESDNAESNYVCKIHEIHLVKYNKDDINIQNEPIEDIRITYDDSYAKIVLSKFVYEPNTSEDDPYIGKWFFKRPRYGDYNFDGRTYKNLCYAFTSVKTFKNNFVYDGIKSDVPVIECFKTIFNEDYVQQNEVLCENTVSGLHIDVTSDHSDNGVSKKNGVIHDLGDFDGLPKYFQYMIDDNIHRAHVESYAIRDGVNRVKSAMDKQSAGLIIDSAIPQNDIKKVTDDMPVIIQFDWNDQINRRYITTSEPVSKKNCLSEITYVDGETFGNSKIAKYSLNDKFVYHGNRLFSLGMDYLDPELEVGRVYVISNDKSVYENNSTTDNKKPPRTFARICDIPTKFSQLVNIKKLAPTLIIDEDYVRTESDFANVDKDMMYNMSNMTHLFRYNNYVVFPWTYNLDLIDKEILKRDFSKYVHLNELINLNDNSNVSFSIDNGGSGYNVGDMFSFYIGGICVKGIVKEVDVDVVSKVSYLVSSDDGTYESDYPVFSYGYTARSNLQTREKSYDTDNISSTGNGLTILVSVNASLWENTSVTTTGLIDDIIAFKSDYFGNVWIWTYDGNKWNEDSQLSGLKVYDNIYDVYGSRNKRSYSDCFINNMINPIMNNAQSFDINMTSAFIPTITKDHDISGNIDYSREIETASFNMQDTFFFLDEGDEFANYHNIVAYENNHINHTSNDLTLPAYHDVNLFSYENKSNKLIACNNEDQQPSLYVYNPTINTVDDTTKVHRDLMIKEGSRQMMLTDIFKGTQYADGSVISNKGVVKRNIYSFNEYDTSDIDELRDSMSNMKRDQLISYIRTNFPKANLLSFEGTEYHYTKDMLIDYIIMNTLYHDRDTCIYNGEDCPETIYRRPRIKLFREVGDSIVDNSWNPIGKQPTGAFQSVTTELFDPDVKVNNSKTSSEPLFIFRIDNDEIDSLSGFRLYDDLDNDISEMSIIILNGEMYFAKVDDTSKEIDWIKIKRLEDD